MGKKKSMSTKNQKLSEEIRQIRNMLILIALRLGATSVEAHLATGMGDSNIRAMFPIKRSKKGRRRDGPAPGIEQP